MVLDIMEENRIKISVFEAASALIFSNRPPEFFQ